METKIKVGSVLIPVLVWIGLIWGMFGAGAIPVQAQTSVTHGSGVPSAGTCNTSRFYGREYMNTGVAPPDLYLCGSTGWQKAGGAGASPAGSTHSIQGNAGGGSFEGIGPGTATQLLHGNASGASNFTVITNADLGTTLTPTFASISTGSSPACANGTGGVWCAGEGTATTPASGVDMIYADVAAHRFLMSNNNGSFVNIVGSGADINTSDQVIATHLASPLPVLQGGTGATTLVGAGIVVGAANLSTVGCVPFQNGTTGTVTCNSGFLFDATNNFSVPGGSNTHPGLNFGGSKNDGFMTSGSGQVEFIGAGSRIGGFENGGIGVYAINGNCFSWLANQVSGPNICLSRLSDGVMAVGTTAAGSTAGTLVATNLRAVGVAVASLPACAGGTQGHRATVTDSNAASFTAGIGAVVAAGGSSIVPVFCDGTNWRIG